LLACLLPLLPVAFDTAGVARCTVACSPAATAPLVPVALFAADGLEAGKKLLTFSAATPGLLPLSAEALAVFTGVLVLGVGVLTPALVGAAVAVRSAI
jgi:hypothetical protein